MSDFQNTLAKALRDEKWDEYEEIWLDAIESERVSFPEILKAARKAADSKASSRAGSILTLLIPTADTASKANRRTFYETLVTCLPKDKDHRETLLEIYREEYGDKPGFDTYVKTADLKRASDPREAIETFLNMVRYLPGTFVYHRSGWGIGEITDLDTVTGNATIDFIEKPGHQVKIDAIPEICQQLPDDDFRVLAWRNPDELKRLADEQPVELVKRVLRTSKRPLALARIREQLSGTVIPSGSWSKWWTKARNEIKKDSHVATTAKKQPEYFILEGPEGIKAELERKLAKQPLKEKLRMVREAVGEVSEEDAEAVRPFIEGLRKDVLLTDGPPHLLLEAILFLDEHKVDLEGLPTVHDVLGRTAHPGDVLNRLQRAEDQKHVIELLRTQDEDGWNDLHADLILRSDDAPRRILIEMMNEEQRKEIDAFAQETVRFPKKAPLFFLWLVRRVSRGELELVPSLRGMRPVDLYTRSISLLNDFVVRSDHESSAELELYVKRFRQHLSGRPFKLLNDSITEADLSSARNVYEQVEASPGFSGTARQGLLAQILRIHPTTLATDSKTRRAQASSLDDGTIYSTERGIEKRRKELQEIRNDKLPAIFKLIGEAAEFGDLSENAEFTSAIEERENLNRRAMEIQSELDRVRVIDPDQASTEFVTLGSRVTLVNTVSNEEQRYALLGPWDGGPEDGVISYQSPIGRALLDKRPDEEFEVELPGGKSKYRVTRIDRYEG